MRETIEALRDFYSTENGYTTVHNPVDTQVVNKCGACPWCSTPLSYEGRQRGNEYHAIMFCSCCRWADEF